MTIDTFSKEIEEALVNYERHVVCLGKTPDECQDSLESLLKKAVHAFETRAPGLRHGIALDKHITIILSQSDTDRPHCGIYFNLYSPYQKQIRAAQLQKGKESTNTNQLDSKGDLSEN